MKIRPANKDDRKEIWEIFRRVISTGDTYVFPPGSRIDEMDIFWLGGNAATYVAEEEGKILGTYMIKPNHTGLGSHIANAGYMVHTDAQGKGIGSAMCGHSLREARRLGYRAMQFNLVVSTNSAAVGLWQKFGFEIIGTIPEAFDHREKGFVDAYIMYRKL